ncbi:hypothetical protein [Sutcliffiella sp. FSL R7-0096]|uniref:hypothetical protein n=1 Tax=Sutcliffiella sp. FSL R7-0096 TaxID=2921670 RepID=UPI00315A8AA0
MIEGSVQISIKDFDKLREESKRLDLLIKSLHRCVANVEDKETEEGSDEWIQIIEVDAKTVARLAAEYADVEEIRDVDIIKLVNVESLETK